MASSSQAAAAAPAAAVFDLPDAPRVLYARNPLAQVICQLRFPSILRIDTELPAAFQERVRGELPVFKEAEADGLPVGLKHLPEDVANFMRLAAPKRPRAFASLDDRWEITLNKDAIALTTGRYHRWEEFRRYLELAIGALQSEYTPAVYTRVGLRYRNLVKRSALGLEGVPWGQLLRDHLAGELAVEGVEPSVESTARHTVMRLPRFGARVGLRHGFVLDNAEVCYTIDNDFFVEANTECGNALEILQFFSGQAHRLFRWCISERLHDAMGPEPLG